MSEAIWTAIQSAITGTAAVTPEQAATWAYPQSGFSAREIVFTLCGALLGRVR